MDSHNPPEYNGFKIVSGSSTIHGEEMQEVRRLIERRDFLTGAGSEHTVDVGGPVMHRLLEKLNSRLPNCSSRWMAVFRIIIPRQVGFWRPAHDRLRARDSQPQTRGHHHWRSEVCAIALRRHPQARRQCHHVAHRPFADQGQNEGVARGTGVAQSGQPLSAQLADLPQTFTTPENCVDCADDIKFEVVKRVCLEHAACVSAAF